ncbi:MAG: hypothetical protein H6817_07840 [Phycisphaerales bacterium]|nr:hypothetical protein [Phycisphaerales bacterium]
MPRKPRVPSYRLHKASGQAVVTIHGRARHLGRPGSDKSKAEYARCFAELTTGAPVQPTGNRCTVLCAQTPA